MNKDRLEDWKNLTATLQSLVTVVAIVAGGVWALWTFGLQRQNYPRLQITQKIAHFKLSDQYTLLVVDEVLSNTGPVLLRLRKGELRVIQVLPLPNVAKQKIAQAQCLPGSDTDPETWTVLASRPWNWGENDCVIEPGETDQLHSEFLVSTEIQLVTVVIYIWNPTGEPTQLGWRTMSMYDLSRGVSKVTRGPDGGR